MQDGLLKNDLSDVEGICFRQGNEIIINPVINKFDIDSQKFPYYDIENVTDRILYFETSRGCPFNCSYCMSSMSKGIDLMSLDKVEESLEVFFQNNVKQVKLVDRTFNYPIKRAINILEIMLALKIKYPDARTSFHCELNPLLINKALANLLRKAPKGFLQFEIGVQTTNPETLQAVSREVDLKKQYDNITMLTSLENITVYVDLIAGLPYETYEIFKKSFNDTYQMKADKLHLGFLKILNGSFMQKYASEYGILYNNHAPYKILKSDSISFEELCHLEKIEILVDTYHNSGNFKTITDFSVSQFSSPYEFYNEFCYFLKSKNHFNRPHKFIYYYEILYEFLSNKQGINKNYTQDLILHDYASNSKPRVYPGCLKTTYNDKKKTIAREFYNNPKNIEKYLPKYIDLPSSTISRQCNLEIFDYDVTSMSNIKRETIMIYDYKDSGNIQKVTLN